jgi:undecaprenyl diphosphate synthase
LDFADVPQLDLVIRTKGKMAQRLSGFMLWWIGYAELYFTEKLFPDFDISDLEEALKWFNDVYEYRNF